MEDLIIQGSKDVYYIPDINFRVDTGELEIAGESYLEDTQEFYRPVLDWLKDYTLDTSKSISFNIKLTYYNTSSSRSILDLLIVLKEFEESGGNVIVNWYVNESDADMIEEIEDFELDSEIKINMIPFEE